MPKSVDIEDFAAKLDLVCKRLNWSRAKLAQQVGVDKSLAGRWLAGSSRPTANSLMRLNAAVTKSLPVFTAADWDRDPASFAAFCGVPVAMDPEAPGSPGGGLSPTSLAVASLGILRGFTSHVTREAETYTGFYWIYFPTVSGDGVIVRRAAEIYLEDDVLRWRQVGQDVDVAGVVFAWNRFVYLVAEQPRLDQPIFACFAGTLLRQPRLLSGMALIGGPNITTGAVMAFRGVLQFLGRPIADPAEREQHWQSMQKDHLTVHYDKAESAGISPEVMQILQDEVPYGKFGQFVVRKVVR